MLHLNDIQNLGNGVFSFNYRNKKDETVTVKFSKETLCYINCDRDEIVICANKEQDIKDQYINDMSNRVDYLMLGHWLENYDEFGMKDSIIKMQAEWYDPTPDNEFNTIFGESWYINPANVRIIMSDKEATVTKSLAAENSFATDECGLVKFTGIFGWTVMKYIDAVTLKNYLTNNEK